MEQPEQPAPGQSAAGGGPGRSNDPVGEMAARFRDLTDRLAALAVPGATPFSWSMGMPPPAGLRDLVEQASLPIAHLERFVDELRERREQLHALQSQLAAFDGQLAALERSLLPLLEWGRAWSRWQDTVFGARPDRPSRDVTGE